jgi:hypothetical protein
MEYLCPFLPHFDEPDIITLLQNIQGSISELVSHLPSVIMKEKIHSSGNGSDVCGRLLLLISARTQLFKILVFRTSPDSLKIQDILKI